MNRSQRYVLGAALLAASAAAFADTASNDADRRQRNFDEAYSKWEAQQGRTTSPRATRTSASHEGHEGMTQRAKEKTHSAAESVRHFTHRQADSVRNFTDRENERYRQQKEEKAAPGNN